MPSIFDISNKFNTAMWAVLVSVSAMIHSTWCFNHDMRRCCKERRLGTPIEVKVPQEIFMGPRLLKLRTKFDYDWLEMILCQCPNCQCQNILGRKIVPGIQELLTGCEAFDFWGSMIATCWGGFSWIMEWREAFFTYSFHFVKKPNDIYEAKPQTTKMTYLNNAIE